MSDCYTVPSSPALLQELLVQADEVQVALGRGIEPPPQLRIEPCTGCLDISVDGQAHLCNCICHFGAADINVCHELLTDTEQGRVWPVAEPVNGAAVDESRELPAPVWALQPGCSSGMVYTGGGCFACACLGCPETPQVLTEDCRTLQALAYGPQAVLHLNSSYLSFKFVFTFCAST